jgi:ADP-ribose pyrophosphatase
MVGPEDVTVDSTESVWKRHTQLDVVRFRHRRFDGRMSAPRTWEVWLRGHAVGVLPYDPRSDQIALIEQFRYPALVAGVDPVMLEIPGGFRDANESEEETGLRELREEMGVAADRLHRVGRFVLTAGGSDESVTILAGRVAAPPAGADGIAGFGGLASENEDIRIRVLPAAAAIEGAIAGRWQNSITAIALLWFAARRDWLREQWLP